MVCVGRVSDVCRGVGMIGWTGGLASSLVRRHSCIGIRVAMHHCICQKPYVCSHHSMSPYASMYHSMSLFGIT